MKTKKIILKLVLTTFILVVICYLLQKFMHSNGNFWSIIPIYWAGSAAYEFQMSTNVSKKVKLVVNIVLIAFVVGLAITFIYILNHN